MLHPLKRLVQKTTSDVEHTHLVNGLDYALLNNVRSEIVKKPEAKDVITDGTPKGSKEDHHVSFRTANAKAVYQWIVKPQTAVKQNDMFLPGRMAFIFDMESGFSHDIPTTVYRSKADCPEPKEMVTVSVDGSKKYGMAPKSTGWLQQVREKDAREKDPNFILDSYLECYPGYQEYNREVVGSDDEDDLSKMDMGGRAKGRLHRWDFETEEERATYNEQKEAMPKAAFQFGVKMQDGRKTRKQIKDQKTKRSLTSCTRLKKYSPKRICKKAKQMMIVVTNLILERNHRCHNPWEIRCDFICVTTVSKCLHNLLSISLGKA